MSSTADLENEPEHFSAGAREDIAKALEEIEDDLEKVAKSKGPFAPKARRALEWLETYREGK